MYIYGSPTKKIVKVSFVTINVNLHKYTCIRMMITHYAAPKSVSFEVQQPMKTSYEGMSEQTINVLIYYIYISWKSL